MSFSPDSSKQAKLKNRQKTHSPLLFNDNVSYTTFQKHSVWF